MRTGIELIADERQRQIEMEGYKANHDDYQIYNELTIAAACYAVNKIVPKISVQDINGSDAFPWADKYDKRDKHDRLRSLAISGALIAAEIDRLQRI